MLEISRVIGRERLTVRDEQIDHLCRHLYNPQTPQGTLVRRAAFQGRRGEIEEVGREMGRTAVSRLGRPTHQVVHLRPIVHDQPALEQGLALV